MPSFADLLLAFPGEPGDIPTAAARGLAVLTANERHFAPLGMPHDSPLKRLPNGH